MRQVGERQREQQRQDTGDHDDGKQHAEVRLELGVVRFQRAFLHLDEAVHLDTDRIHQPLALATAHGRNHASHIVLASQLDDTRHLRQFGIYQWGYGVQVRSRIADRRQTAQLCQLEVDESTHRQIWFQERLVTSQRITALTGFRVRQCRQQILRAVQHEEGVLAGSGCVLRLSERPNGNARHQSDDQDRSDK